MSEQELRKKLLETLLEGEDDRRYYDNERFEPDVFRLKNCYDMYTKDNKFSPGDIVVWKDGLRNKILPFSGQPAVVIECREEPFIAENDPGSAYFKEILDLRLGLIEPDGDFVMFYFDSRRFRPAEERTTQEYMP